jgi:formate dehydrogenase major subunit
MIQLTIDDRSIEVPEGTTVLQAARQAQVHIPTLCDHPELKPYGGCRLCVVEVEGFRTLQPSCTLPATKGLVVHTTTEAVKKARYFVLSMLFSERNHFCPFCQVSGGDCELQNAAYGEDMTHWPMQPGWDKFSVDATHPYFVLDNNRCILCRRCVRACGELVGNFTLGVEERGAATLLIADVGVPLGESTCIKCGTCVQVCPTGALIDRISAYQGHDAEVTKTQSICVGCSVGCGVTLVTRDNRLVRIESDWESTLNEGLLCEVGRYRPMTDQRERITQPLIRQNGKLQPATWDGALKVIADRVKPLMNQGDHGVAAVASTRLPAEALSLFKQIFAQSEMVTSVEEGLPTARASQLAGELGPFEAKLEALKEADAVIAIGVDLGRSHQVAGFFVKRVRPLGIPLIVIDPNENKLDSFAKVSIKPKAGADVETLRALLAAAKGEAATDGDIVEAAKLIRPAKNPVIVYGKGLTAFSDAKALKALIEYARHINAKVIGVKGEANSVAAAQYGLDRALALNGHQAVYIAVGDDYVTDRLIQRLEKAPFVVAQASYASKLTALADVVLPVEMWAEQAGHFVSLDGRVQETVKVLDAPKDVRSNVDALKAVAQELGIDTADNWKEALLQRKPMVRIE